MLYRLGNMLRLDCLAAGSVSKRARQPSTNSGYECANQTSRGTLFVHS
jgi:hypothetical protein